MMSAPRLEGGTAGSTAGSTAGRTKSKETIRKTVQISRQLLDALEVHAEAEALPVASLVRRAILSYVRGIENGTGSDIDTNPFADHERKGKRGPSTQWPIRVSYVLDQELSAAVEKVADNADETTSEVVRKAITSAVQHDLVPKLPKKRVGHGFVTAAAPVNNEEAEAAIADVQAAIRRAK